MMGQQMCNPSALFAQDVSITLVFTEILANFQCLLCELKSLLSAGGSTFRRFLIHKWNVVVFHQSLSDEFPVKLS